MREYRYYFLASLVFTTIGFYILYDAEILNENDFLWPTVVWSPLFGLTTIAFINFAGPENDQSYSQERVDAVKKSASTPLKILQSPIVWLGLISAVVITFAFLM